MPEEELAGLKIEMTGAIKGTAKLLKVVEAFCLCRFLSYRTPSCKLGITRAFQLHCALWSLTPFGCEGHTIRIPWSQLLETNQVEVRNQAVKMIKWKFPSCLKQTPMFVCSIIWSHVPKVRQSTSRLRARSRRWGTMWTTQHPSTCKTSAAEAKTAMCQAETASTLHVMPDCQNLSAWLWWVPRWSLLHGATTALSQLTQPY